MAPTKTLPEFDRVVEQAQATAIALSKLGVEIHATLADPHPHKDLALAAHVKRAALALASLAGLVGQIEALARIGTLLIFALVVAACGGTNEARQASDLGAAGAPDPGTGAAGAAGTPDLDAGAAGAAGETGAAGASSTARWAEPCSAASVCGDGLTCKFWGVCAWQCSADPVGLARDARSCGGSCVGDGDGTLWCVP